MIGAFFVVASKILGTKYGAAGSQGRKRLDNQHVYGVHKRDGGNGGRTHVAYHHGVHGSHQAA